MDFPKNHLKYLRSRGEKESQNGWLVLDVKALDLEGVTKIYLNMDDVDAVQDRKAASEAEAERLKKLLGG
jgi:hypothetical protein